MLHAGEENGPVSSGGDELTPVYKNHQTFEESLRVEKVRPKSSGKWNSKKTTEN